MTAPDPSLDPSLDASSEPSIAAAVKQVLDRVSAAALRLGRPADSVCLIAVTKTCPAEAICAAYAAGVRHFGENRVQEWEAKRAQVGDLPGAAFHMIGHLQRNKARRAVALFQRIDSVDNLALARKLDEFAAQAERILPVLIEVRLSEEPDKTGVEPGSLFPLAQEVARCSHLSLRGLMTIPPWSEQADFARPYFRRLRELRDEIAGRLAHPLPVLSMGMTHDFEIAIEEGATEVRVGTGIFGPRAGPAAEAD
ncbi:MAG TPA: YggS family pyridoxal phosphate-dependent enzyme [Candidatus Dormibacteraeota bacterium]|nr:YggS family pyridoxal phosphate-dependent enzyme [Candidatus Dormibacteraeota bacterium]